MSSEESDSDAEVGKFITKPLPWRRTKSVNCLRAWIVRVNVTEVKEAG